MALSQKARKALEISLGKGAGAEVADAIDSLVPAKVVEVPATLESPKTESAKSDEGA